MIAGTLALAPVRVRAQSAGDTLALSIQAAVERAMRQSDEALLAEAQIAVTAAQLETARASALPQLRLNGSYSHAIENARAQAVGSIFNQPNTYNINANLSQTFFQGGREFAAIRAARRLRQSAQLGAVEARREVTIAVERAYLQTLFAGRLLDIQTQNLQLAADRLSQVEQLERAGRAARYDVLRARVERANNEPQVIQARSDRDLAGVELRRLLALPMTTPLALTTAVDTAAVRGFLVAFARDSLAEPDRPAVHAAELVASARREAITIARADYLPTISAFIQSGYQAFPLSGFPSSWGEASIHAVPCTYVRVDAGTCNASTQNGGFFSDKQIGVLVSWPLFDGLRTKGNIDLARAQANLAEVQLDQERQAVAVEVSRARAELARSRSAFEAQRQNAEEAGEAFHLATLRYTRGLGTQLDASNAQLALFTAETNQARSVYDLYLATATLAYALGRPIPLPPAAPGAPIQTTSTNKDDRK
jgi:outer membrane protein TolC